jgi:uncharacterized paraquat-inducible protein A
MSTPAVRTERMSGSEIYRLDCDACGHTVTLPAVDGEQRCPNCGAALHVAWSAERAAFLQETVPMISTRKM